jgi:hypothetical protein
MMEQKKEDLTGLVQYSFVLESVKRELPRVVVKLGSDNVRMFVDTYSSITEVNESTYLGFNPRPKLTP